MMTGLADGFVPEPVDTDWIGLVTAVMATLAVVIPIRTDLARWLRRFRCKVLDLHRNAWEDVGGRYSCKDCGGNNIFAQPARPPLRYRAQRLSRHVWTHWMDAWRRRRENAAYWRRLEPDEYDE